MRVQGTQPFPGGDHISHATLGEFAPEGKPLEAEGNDPSLGSPNRTVTDLGKLSGFPHGPGNSTSAALTNIVPAAPMDPQFASLAKDLEIMGGYVDLNMLEATSR
ncbi:hypothetical protein N7491_009803 [Penicillium cf. griseofulvum]|uniref:Uncharacterized protein n=1 Tax=Penicillium cf. griseofulvum TaxID=2972120 RepID=A0A9W9MYY7_9EURO|nr:hypothetical protein N7472_000131 [Penicillium cf. griseofulvum]KAJ5421358.1 hypothetical protein N7491_009803 [Penicillium cf. griseofulvum]KAJ5424593.1 hypothetical protein N7445_010566 [Penicillium cf. griseofulvum]